MKRVNHVVMSESYMETIQEILAKHKEELNKIVGNVEGFGVPCDFTNAIQLLIDSHEEVRERWHEQMFENEKSKC